VTRHASIYLKECIVSVCVFVVCSCVYFSELIANGIFSFWHFTRATTAGIASSYTSYAWCDNFCHGVTWDPATTVSSSRSVALATLSLDCRHLKVEARWWASGCFVSTNAIHLIRRLIHDNLCWSLIAAQHSRCRSRCRCCGRCRCRLTS